MTAPPRSQGMLVTVLAVVVLLMIGVLAHVLLGVAHLFGILVEVAAAVVIAFLALGLARFLSVRLSAPEWLWGLAFALPTFVGSLDGGFMHDALFGLAWLFAGIVGARSRP